MLELTVLQLALWCSMKSCTASSKSCIILCSLETFWKKHLVVVFHACSLLFHNASLTNISVTPDRPFDWSAPRGLHFPEQVLEKNNCFPGDWNMQSFLWNVGEYFPKAEMYSRNVTGTMMWSVIPTSSHQPEMKSSSPPMELTESRVKVPQTQNIPEYRGPVLKCQHKSVPCSSSRLNLDGLHPFRPYDPEEKTVFTALMF